MNIVTMILLHALVYQLLQTEYNENSFIFCLGYVLLKNTSIHVYALSVNHCAEILLKLI